jgi:hypothetical protein
MEVVAYEDLFDIEKRPGAGARLWRRAVELQLERVREANYSHRLHHSPNEQQQKDDPDAVQRLHTDVYFLALAIRRVLLFHDLLAKHVADPRLAQARAKFETAAHAKELRDFYEHLDEYLLDSPKKQVKFPGRAAPVLHCRWGCDNVTVSFGKRELDITLAAVAAIELGRESEALWDEHLERIKRENPTRPRRRPMTGSSACWRSRWASPRSSAARMRATSCIPAPCSASKCETSTRGPDLPVVDRWRGVGEPSGDRYGNLGGFSPEA